MVAEKGRVIKINTYFNQHKMDSFRFHAANYNNDGSSPISDSHFLLQSDVPSTGNIQNLTQLLVVLAEPNYHITS